MLTRQLGENNMATSYEWDVNMAGQITVTRTSGSSLYRVVFMEF